VGVPQLSHRPSDADRAWTIVLAAARHADRLADAHERTAFAITDAGQLRLAEKDAHAVLAWHPGSGWALALRADDPRSALIDLYLPICSATSVRPVTVAHLGQSLDGFIATHAGESRWVTGQENMVHMHRLRALCDAVVVGSGTVAADDPQLTTRLVEGPNPVRVVLDPSRRLEPRHRVFTDRSAETLYVCSRSLVRAGENRFGCATIVGVEGSTDRIDPAALMRLLHERGFTRVFVEGGGVTVSMFLEANQLDRLHMTVAPLLIGDGRPAIRLPAPAALGDCHRPRYRVFRMGGDVLFDCELGAPADDEEPDRPPVTRIV
jgi:riboflavin-specific deaminase-like protein